jgi:4-amino-4-deoxy-L-arabinose transferase-like glycosyltransferase
LLHSFIDGQDIGLQPPDQLPIELKALSIAWQIHYRLRMFLENASHDRKNTFFLIALFVCFLHGLHAIHYLGYIGQDFAQHLGYHNRFSFFHYDYGSTNPPALYVISTLIERYLSKEYFLEITGLTLLLTNLVALFLFLGFFKRLFSSQWIFWSAALICIFLPFRVEHSIIYSSDALTFLPFCLVAILSCRLYKKSDALLNWGLIGLVMSVAIYSKYTFVGMLAALGIVLLHRTFSQIKVRRGKELLVGFVAILIPSLYFLFAMRMSHRSTNFNTFSHFKTSDSAEMNWGDLFSLRKVDLRLLNAPTYPMAPMEDTQSSTSIIVNHRHSYLALVHLATFTDVLRYFQKLPPQMSIVWGERPIDDLSLHSRTRLQQFLSEISVTASLPITILALIGTILGVFTGARFFLAPPTPKNCEIAMLTLFAVSFHSVIFFSLPFVTHTYLKGYWLPRLIMPSLITYIFLGFIFLDRLAKSRPMLKNLILIYSGLMSTVWLVMLWIVN